jgi:flagellar hook-associated protein 1 FlgK
MSGIANILEIARGALLTEKNALEVTGHNVANVNTPGYSVQKTVFEPTRPVPMSYGIVGGGVDTAEIVRTYSQFLNDQLNDKNRLASAWDAKQQILALVEAAFNESDNTGINELLSEFWGSWEDLANNPSGLAERAGLVAKATTLTEAFREKAIQLSALQGDLDASIHTAVQEVDRYAQQVADLNEKIVAMETEDFHANDFRDQRDLILEKLSELIPIDYLENARGSVSVFLPGGYPLVENTTAWNLDTELDEYNSLRVIWSGSTDVTSRLDQGKLGGWLEMRDSIIPKYQEALNGVAAHLANMVNTVHRQGIDGNGDAGGDFFTYQPGFSIIPAAENMGNATFPGLNPRFYNITTGLYEYDPTKVTGDCYTFAFTGMTPADLTITNRSTGQVVTPDEAIDNGDGTYTYTFDGLRVTVGGTPRAGDQFFFRANWNLAENLAVDPSIAANLTKIAAATTAGAPGDNTNALAIANLRHKSDETIMTQTGTLSDLYDAVVVGEVGNDSANSKNQSEFNAALVHQIKDSRDSVAGVSLDEEMTNMIKFQQAFAAAAKLITLADELFQTVLDTKR